MAHQVIKYRLNDNGTVPDFLCVEENSVGGEYLVYDSVYPAPRNFTMIGISCDGVSGDFQVFDSEQELESYLEGVSASWFTPSLVYQPVANDPASADVGKIPFVPATAAAEVWAKLEALNAQ